MTGSFFASKGGGRTGVRSVIELLPKSQLPRLTGLKPPAHPHPVQELWPREIEKLTTGVEGLPFQEPPGRLQPGDLVRRSPLVHLSLPSPRALSPESCSPALLPAFDRGVGPDPGARRGPALPWPGAQSLWGRGEPRVRKGPERGWGVGGGRGARAAWDGRQQTALFLRGSSLVILLFPQTPAEGGRGEEPGLKGTDCGRGEWEPGLGTAAG